ncbi:MAG: acyl-CoA carboxylase subunit beta, partial [Betaproteobacteria bacterium]|nr:acyl-CoA carboxylase subunit beta [Betaproteobacteria bacterium]
MFVSSLRPGHPNFESRKQAMLEAIDQLRTLEARTVQKSASAKPRFDKRGQLLPRERLARLLDPGAPWLELSTMAGFGLDRSELEKSVPGGGVITGIGFVSGVRTLINISDAGIDAGAIQHMGREKILRGQQIALQNRLPYLQLIESAGANLLRYQVEGFVEGGRIFANLARLSAAGLPVIAIVHGASTAGGAYMPGLSDYVIMVRGRAKAFLAGPPLLKAATGEIANDEELGGAEMHTQVSGLGEYLADDDAHAIDIARNLMQRLGWQGNVDGQANPSARSGWLPPRYASEELMGIMPADFREPVDMREVIIRLVDDSDFLDFQPDYGPQTLVGHAAIEGYPIGIITNNGPIDTAGSHKATHFIQACCQAHIPLLYLQNTTGYMVGKVSEQTGMIKHGSKMIQAVANANVPSITIHCGASFGAGNYGMCGRGFDPRFIFSWPHAKTAVMGAEQAATTMRMVAEAGAARKGETV